MIGSSRRQREILTYIEQYVARHKRPPTRKEIALHFEFTSDNAAQCHLVAMAQKGMIKLTPRIARGIELVEGS